MNQQLAEEKKTTSFWRTAAISTAVFSVLAFVFSSVIAAVWAQEFDGRVAPRVMIGRVDVSGLDRDRARERVQQAVDERLAQGIAIDLNGRAAEVPLTSVNGNGDASEYVTFDIDTAVDAALAQDRSENPALDVALLLKRRFLGATAVIPVPVEINQDALGTLITAAYPDSTISVEETRFRFTKGRAGWSATVIAGHGGRALDLPAFWPRAQAALERLDTSPVALTMTRIDPLVTEEEAELVRADAIAVLDRGPITFVDRIENPTRSWPLSTARLAPMIEPRAENGRIILGVNKETFDEFLDETVVSLEIPAQNARFQIVDGKVVEFAGSKSGLTLDREAARREFETIIGSPNATQSVALTLVETLPDVTTDQVNDLGITEELGVGFSSYKGSPRNRIRNIRNGVNLLNGILIAPGETFSLINALKPFDTANGYLPELVIKGDKIEPEIGGGLCQIGTTTFRAVMGAGLPVVERRNHSLVVSYYNDPSNKLPGTDATIYDPAPDFKFLNDTGNYLLLQTVMDEVEQSLYFHFWGTKDGRTASYTPPKVLRWIPVGPAVRTETPDLPAGQEKCQESHVGADTTFTYTIVRPDGTPEETVFESHYRPLPRICLVGTAAPATPIPVEEISTDPGATPTTPEIPPST